MQTPIGFLSPVTFTVIIMWAATFAIIVLLHGSGLSILAKELELSYDRPDLDSFSDRFIIPGPGNLNLEEDVSVQGCPFQMLTALSKCYQQTSGDLITTPSKGKRSLGCMQRCVAGGMLHPAQCHSLCK